MIDIGLNDFFHRRILYFLDNPNNFSFDHNGVYFILNSKEFNNKNKMDSKTYKTYIYDFEVNKDVDVFQIQNSTTKNSIRFCEKTNVEYHVFTNAIPPYVVEEFLEMLKKMYKEKGLKTRIVKKSRLKKYICLNSLVFTRTSLNCKALTYHVYVADGNKCVLWFSCSDFRDSEANKSLIGKANRYNHYRDIVYFKDEGYSLYDWGGVSSFDNPNGIDFFKFSFPGEKIIQNESIVYVGFIGKLYRFLKHLV